MDIHPETGTDGLTRRAAFARFAMVLAGAAASRMWIGEGLANAATNSGFDARRRTIFAAVAETYDGEGWIKLRSGQDLTGLLAERYEASNSSYRAWVDALLDAVDVGPSAGRLVDMTVPERRKELRTWNLGSDDGNLGMRVARPSDANEPGDLASSNARNAEAIRNQLAKLPAGAMDLDRLTGLPKYAPLVPARAPIVTGGPLDGEGRLRRQLRHNCYVLLSSLFADDVRHLTDEAFA